MPVELSDILGNKRWVEVELGEHILKVAYRPGSSSLMQQAEIQRKLRELQNAKEADEVALVKSMASVFCEIICDWDLVNKGQPVPINVTTVSALPGVIYNAAMNAVIADGKVKAEGKKPLSETSSDGSQPPTRQAVAQNGISPYEQPATWA